MADLRDAPARKSCGLWNWDIVSSIVNCRNILVQLYVNVLWGSALRFPLLQRLRSIKTFAPRVKCS